MLHLYYPFKDVCIEKSKRFELLIVIILHCSSKGFLVVKCHVISPIVSTHSNKTPQHNFNFPTQLEDIDLPVERTENMIMKYFNKSWGSFCSNLLGEGMVKVREEVLMKVLL